MGSIDKEKKKKKKSSSKSREGSKKSKSAAKLSDEGEGEGLGEEKHVQKEQGEKDTKRSVFDRPLSAFEHGQLFYHYSDGGGVMTREKFMKMMKDLKLNVPAMQSVEEKLKKESEAARLEPKQEFDAGMLFARHDPTGRGSIDRQSFQNILKELGINLPAPETAASRERDRLASGNENPYSHFGPGSIDPTYGPYTTPLPHVQTIPGEFDDTRTALLRRDYIHLRGLLQATLAPRIEQEVTSIDAVETTKKKIREEAKRIEKETMSLVEDIVKRLSVATDKLCKEADELRFGHEESLRQINRFQQLAFGPRPRDALNMEHFTTVYPTLHNTLGLYSSQPSSSAVGSTADGENEDPARSPPLQTYYMQRDHAQAQYHHQERNPHPVVMRDFVALFEEFKSAAHRIVTAPPSLLAGSSKVKSETHTNTVDALSNISNKRLPRELWDQKQKAEKYDQVAKEMELKDQMIFTMVQEREEYESEKQSILQQIEQLSEKAGNEIQAWSRLNDQTTRELTAQIARLQQQQPPQPHL